MLATAKVFFFTLDVKCSITEDQQEYSPLLNFCHQIGEVQWSLVRVKHPQNQPQTKQRRSTSCHGHYFLLPLLCVWLHCKPTKLVVLVVHETVRKVLLMPFFQLLFAVQLHWSLGLVRKGLGCIYPTWSQTTLSPRSRLVLCSSFALGQVLQGIPTAQERVTMVQELLLLPLCRYAI